MWSKNGHMVAILKIKNLSEAQQYTKVEEKIYYRTVENNKS